MSEEVFIWDLQLVVQPDGSVAVLRQELQSPDNELFVSEAQIEDFPPGTVRVHSLIEAFRSGEVLYTNESGMVIATHGSKILAGSIDENGEVINFPGMGGGSGSCRYELTTFCSIGFCGFGGCVQSGNFGPLCFCTNGSGECPGNVLNFQCVASGCASCVSPGCTCGPPDPPGP
ncbi:MAG: hypothetical protein AAF533_26965 [Acidobacteriota bacterium]